MHVALHLARKSARAAEGPKPYLSCRHGAWRSLVARLLWEQEVAGSNPAAPITLVEYAAIRELRCVVAPAVTTTRR
jgi:hypothetical protein